jgi:hypothetical protein
MAVVLTDAQIAQMVLSAYWRFDVDFRDNRDSVVYTGDGVDDLTSLIDDVETATTHSARPPKMLCDR